MNIVVYIPGNQDIQRGGNRLKHYREETKAILEEGGATLKNAPLLRQTLKGIESCGIDSPHFHFIATDQEDPKFRAKDTIWAGEILKKILQDERKWETTLHVIRSNPSDYIEAMREVEIIGKELIAGDNDIHLFLGPGTPALNFAAGVWFAGHAARVIFYHVREGDIPRVIPLSRPIKKMQQEKMIHALLADYAFHETARLLQEPPLDSVLLNQYALCGYHLTLFNVEKAWKVITDYDPQNDRLARFKNHVQRFYEKRESSYLLRLSWANIARLEKRKEYQEVVGQLYTFLDRVLTAILQKEILGEEESRVGFMSEKEEYELWKRIINRVDLSSFQPIVKRTENNDRLDKYDLVSLINIAAHIRFKKEEEKERLKWLYYDLIRNHRHRGPYGHGFNALTERDIAKAGMNSIHETIRPILQAYLGERPSFFYDDLKKGLVEALDKT